MSSTIESVLQETRVFPPSAEFVRQANISGMEAYRKLCAEAERDFEGFWGRLAKEHVLWHKPFTGADESKRRFFSAGYYGELNASYNCLPASDTQPEMWRSFRADDCNCEIAYRAVPRSAAGMRQAMRETAIASDLCRFDQWWGDAGLPRIGATHSYFRRLFPPIPAERIYLRPAPPGHPPRAVSARQRFRSSPGTAFACCGCEKVPHVSLQRTARHRRCGARATMLTTCSRPALPANRPG